MKIIDTHTHLPGWTFGGKPRPIADLRREFTAAGLCGAWLYTTDGCIMEPEKNNDILAEAVKNDRDFFMPFCTVSPHAGEQAAIREMERCQRQFRMRGVKFHPWLQAFSMTARRLTAVPSKSPPWRNRRRTQRLFSAMPGWTICMKTPSWHAGGTRIFTCVSVLPAVGLLRRPFVAVRSSGSSTVRTADLRPT